MKGRGRNHRTLIAGLCVGMLGMAVIGAAGCGYSESKERSFELAVTVQDDQRAPLEDLEVRVWLVEEAIDGGREIVELEPATTGTDGIASFEYRAVLQPYICGYRISSASGDVLLEEPPVQHRYLSGSSGEITLSI